MIQDISIIAQSRPVGLDKVAAADGPRKTLKESPYGLLIGGDFVGKPQETQLQGAPSEAGWAAAVEAFSRQQESGAQQRAYVAMGREYQRTAGMTGDAGQSPVLFAAMQAGTAFGGPEAVGVAGTQLAGQDYTGRFVRSGPEAADSSSLALSPDVGRGGATGQSTSGGIEVRSSERTFMNSSSATGDPEARRGVFGMMAEQGTLNRKAQRAYTVASGDAFMTRGSIFSAAV